ncbi:MAG: riboflavin biosynthesis protein RibF [Verrucomicrobiales bacterium]|nr:riboflavin biosynthesis protein RibF [Verrucomicrobiales bacterium]
MIRRLEEIGGLSALKGPVNLAIGMFDGVHRGHAALISAVTNRAGTPVVLTFEPHPAEVLGAGTAPRQISSREHKQAILGRLGIECLLSVEFNHQRAAQKAADFVREIAGSCPLGCVAVGMGFRFGQGREGDVDLLAGLGDDLGFEVCGIAPVCDDQGEVISSTRIRSALKVGDVGLAGELLGRPYSLVGEVTEGKRIGQSIGFPTANIPLRGDELLPFGVYAVCVDLNGEHVNGVANLGTRPTITSGNEAPLLEVHLFDFNRDIYGREIEVSFKARIRDERTFEGVESLRAQIGNDVQLARELLARPAGDGVA